MTRAKTLGSLAAAAALAAALGLPARAEAHGHRGAVYVGVGYGGFYGWGPYGGWGWGGPYWAGGWGWGPYGYGYGAQAGLLGYAMMSGMGGLDVDVKPNRAEVWVDGKYVAEARDLDGDPSYLWLKQGTHRVVVYKDGFKSFDEEVDVRTGVLRPLNVKLEPGESQPPVRAAGEAVRPEARVESAAPATGVALRIEPRDATVYVDGKYLGIVRDLGVLQLEPGHHRLELARPGYLELAKEFDVEAGRKAELALSMERGKGWKY